MIEIDRRDDGDFGIHQIGGIQPPAEAGLQHDHVDAGSIERNERHGRHRFEKAWMYIDLIASEKTLGGCVNFLKRRAPV